MTNEVDTTKLKSDFTIDFDDIFDDYIASNQKVWAHDRSQTLGASEVFDCLRKAWFNKRGAEFKFLPNDDWEDDWGAMVRGDVIENHFVVPALANWKPPGIRVELTGEDQVTLVVDKNSATPDGLITGLPMNCSLRVRAGKQNIYIPNIKSDCVVLEIKSIDPRATLLEERTKHNGQTQVQIGLFHERTSHKPYYSIVLYVDASFFSKITPFVVEYDPSVYAAAKQRAGIVWQIDDPNEILPEGRFADACSQCKWSSACGTATVSAIPKYEEDTTATPETIEEMDRRVQIFLKAQADVKKAELEVAAAKEYVKEMLMSRNTRKMRSEKWSLSWYGQDGQKRVDLKAMEADGIDLEKYKKAGSAFDVLRITERLEDTNDKPKKTRKSKKENPDG